MNVSKTSPSRAAFIPRLAQSCFFIFATLGFVFAIDSVAYASDPVTLTVDAMAFPGPPVLGLQTGDPITVIFEFDSTTLASPGLPPGSGAINFDSVEVQVGGLTFELADPLNAAVPGSVLPAGNSGFIFNADLSGVLQETNQNDLTLGPITALPTLVSFQTGDIGVNDLSRFPTAFSGDDVINSFGGAIFSISDANENLASFSIEIVDVTVSTVPEPSSATLMLVSFVVLTTRRRRNLVS